MLGQKLGIFFLRIEDTKISFWNFLTFTENENIDIVNIEGKEKHELVKTQADFFKGTFLCFIFTYFLFQ